MDNSELRGLLSKARYWRCTRDAMRCMDGNGCECEMAGDPDPLPPLQSAAVNALPRLLADSDALQNLRAEIAGAPVGVVRGNAEWYGEDPIANLIGQRVALLRLPAGEGE